MINIIQNGGKKTFPCKSKTTTFICQNVQVQAYYSIKYGVSHHTHVLYASKNQAGATPKSYCHMVLPLVAFKLYKIWGNHASWLDVHIVQLVNYGILHLEEAEVYRQDWRHITTNCYWGTYSWLQGVQSKSLAGRLIFQLSISHFCMQKDVVNWQQIVVCKATMRSTWGQHVKIYAQLRLYRHVKCYLSTDRK